MTTTLSSSTDALTPAAVRAARGLANISIGALAEISGVGSRTIARFEAGEAVPARATAVRLLDALARLGIDLIRPTSEHGSGAFLRKPGGEVTLVRRDVLRGDEEIGVMLRFSGRATTARVQVQALDAAGNVDAALSAFDQRPAEIMAAIARKLGAEDFDQDGHVRIRVADLTTDA